MDNILLSNGVEMPPIVETTNWMDYPTMKKLVTAGLQIGFRAFDTARDYGNEDIVGQVMKECLAEQGLKREDVFITTKIGNGQQALGNIEEQIDISLKNLQTDYVDLWLMHWPYPDYYIDTWHKMETVYKSGKVRAIGMANYRIRHFEHLFSAGVEVMPHCVQMELHPMRTATDIVAYCKERDIAIQAYSPLCRMIPEIRNNAILNDIAKETGKSVGQVILRWHIQNKTVPVFKSLKPTRLAENFDIFDFSLTEEQMSRISSLDQDYKYHLESASCPGY
jgi:methylglyoxal/glyoxal reductase